MTALALGIGGVALAVYGARQSTHTLGRYIEAHIGKPSLVRETSRLNFRNAVRGIQSPMASVVCVGGGRDVCSVRHEGNFTTARLSKACQGCLQYCAGQRQSELDACTEVARAPHLCCMKYRGGHSVLLVLGVRSSLVVLQTNSPADTAGAAVCTAQGHL